MGASILLVGFAENKAAFIWFPCDALRRLHVAPTDVSSIRNKAVRLVLHPSWSFTGVTKRSHASANHALDVAVVWL